MSNQLGPREYLNSSQRESWLIESQDSPKKYVMNGGLGARGQMTQLIKLRTD